MTAAFALVLLRLASMAADTPEYRPQFHFSPQTNWTNDPNGLVFFEGEYHLFFQFNPFGDKWGHMSWGHAVSRDLLHWTQLPVALPEEKGVMIFTGSTVVDARNTSGFCQDAKPCLVAVYTGHTPEHDGKKALQTQNVAYSNDRGRHWTKYANNPVLDLHMSDFRDPKVFWSDQSRHWVMVVALPDDHKALLYSSSDLKSWKPLSEFGPAGATSGQWECPELFQVPVEGGRVSHWVLKIGLNPGALQGGSGEQYFIGDFDGTKFTNSNPAATTLWTDYGKDCYCALTFNNQPKSQPPVMMGWMNNWQYAADVPTSPWRGQMTVPRKLSLRQTKEGLRLYQQPVDALKVLRGKEQLWSGQDIAAVNESLAAQPLPAGNAFEIEATLEWSGTEPFGIRLVSGNGDLSMIGYEPKGGTLFVDRTKSGATSFNKNFPARVSAPLPAEGRTLQLHIVGDRNSLEVFADGGRVAMTELVFPPKGARHLELVGGGGSLRSSTVRVWRLGSAVPQ